MSVIYQITNMIDGKYYIGSTNSYERRMWQHKYDLRRGCHKNPKLQTAWTTYGEEAFVFEVIEQVAESQDLLLVEDTYLLQHVGNPNCYNINPTAESPRTGVLHTEVAKKKMSNARKGKAAGENHYRYGKKLSKEVREKIGRAQRGKPKAPGRTLSEEGRAKVRANIEAGRSHIHWRGRKHTKEAKDKMSKPVFVMPDGILFPSLTLVLQYYGLKMPTLRRALLSGRSLVKGRCRGFTFTYGGIGTKPTEFDLERIRSKLVDAPL